MQKLETDISMKITLTLGRKRRFGVAGISNVIATNLLLQLLLGRQSSSTGLATLISQLFNGCFGYAIYGGWVFRSRNIRRIRSGILYAAMMAMLWCFNTAGIHLLAGSGVLNNRNIAALIMIAPLAILSYLLQKHFIFRSTPQAQ
jgi:putative flippase GtrA